MMISFAGLVARYGYATVLGVVALEGVGVPVPGETAVVTAGALAARGELSLPGVILAAFIGVVLGGSGGYWIGEAGGLPLLRRHGRWLRMSDERLARAHEFFERHGAWTVFIARFVALLRMLAGVLAGVGQMGFARYSLYNALGGIAWAGAVGGVGFEFGANLPALHRYAARVSLLVVLLVAVVVGLAVLWRRFDVSADVLWNGVRELRLWALSRPVVRRELDRHPRLWRFVARRFAAGEYLGLHLTIGLLVSLSAMWLFGAITEDVVHHDPLTRFDFAVLAWVHGFTSPAGYRVAEVASLVGSPVAMGVIAVVGGLVLAVRRMWLMLSGWLVAFTGGAVLDTSLKLIIQRPRPAGASAFLHGASFSFPSGHAMGSLVGYGMLAYLLTVTLTRRGAARSAVIGAAAVLVLLIGLSRLYLGVHYFSDVVGGYAAGLLWLAACVSGLEVARRRRALGLLVSGVAGAGGGVAQSERRAKD